MERNRPKIVIADDHTLVAEACKKLLEAEYDVVATVGDGEGRLLRAPSENRQLYWNGGTPPATFAANPAAATASV